jgi:hypothetical protein
MDTTDKNISARPKLDGLTIADVRPEVLAFALLMERELRINDHKGGWKNDTARGLVRHMVEEAHELREQVFRKGYWPVWRPAQPGEENEPGREVMALYSRGETSFQVIDRYEFVSSERSTQRIGSEAADLANMAMMVADVCGALGPR